MRTFNCIFVILLYLSSLPSLATNNELTNNNSSKQPHSKDSLWGYSSDGREIFDVITSDGGTITVVDVDGLAYSGDMILGKTEALKQHGLKLTLGEEFPEDEATGPLGAIRYPSSGYKWPNGIVPYVFAPNLGNQARQDMQYAFNHWRDNTNVRFVPRSNQRDYIYIQNGNGCSSWIGKQGGQQTVTLADGCGRGAAVHELGHAVGFFHEQTRIDRDNYVHIYWNNIRSDMVFNFYKMNTNEGQDHGAYDYRSIMHYRTTAFGINGAITLWPKQSGVDTNYMGNGTILSAGDIAATAAIYGNGGGGNGQTYFGSLSGSGDVDYQPDGNWFQYNGGTIRATLQGPSNTNFDLYLYRWTGSNWQVVASSTTANSNESLNYNANSGYYLFSLYSRWGSGNYTFSLEK